MGRRRVLFNFEPSSKLSWCQIFLLPNCSGAKLSWCQIIWGQNVMVPNCLVTNCPGAKLSWCQIVWCYNTIVPNWLGAKLSSTKLSCCQIVWCQIVWCQISPVPFVTCKVNFLYIISVTRRSRSDESHWVNDWVTEWALALTLLMWPWWVMIPIEDLTDLILMTLMTLMKDI